MKYLKSYNESIRDKMAPKSDEDIKSVLSKMDIYDKLKKIKYEGLSDKFLPSDDEIKEYLSDLNDIEEKIRTINNLSLSDKFLPLDDEIKEYLSGFDVEDWMNMVYELDLGGEFNPPDEKLLKYILPIHITYNSENITLEFSEWSNFDSLFKENKDVREGYIESVLSGMGHEYFERYDTIEPTYFDFSDVKIFQDVKTQIKEKIDESDLSNEDEYDEMINDFNSSKSFSNLYDHVLTKYDILEDIKDAINNAFTSSQEMADESEAYNSLTNNIIKTFNGGEVKYDSDKRSYVMPITIPDLDVNDIVDNGKIIEWSIPYYGWSGDVDDDTFREDITNRLYDI